MSEPGGDPSSGISSGDALIRPERHPACRRREARPGFRMERENLCFVTPPGVKGQAASGSNREGESTEAGRRGGAARSSVEGHVMGLERRGYVVRPWSLANWKREEPVDEAKPFKIPKREVWEAFKRVKANQGAAGVDGQSVAEFEANLSGNFYKLWNRLSSGSYFPPPVVPHKAGSRPYWQISSCITRSTRGWRGTLRTSCSRGTRTTSFVIARAPRRRGHSGARWPTAWRPASWCCILRRRRSSTARMSTGAATFPT